ARGGLSFKRRMAEQGAGGAMGRVPLQIESFRRGQVRAHRSNEPQFRAGDIIRISYIVSSDYVNFRRYPGTQMGILHREDAVGQQICAHLSLRDAYRANPQSGRLSSL